MTNEQILGKAIKKVVKSGAWKGINPLELCIDPREDLHLEQKIIEEMLRKPYITELIFSHDFAKAFWGEEKRDGIIGIPHKMVKDQLAKKITDNLYDVSVKRNYVPEWMYRLQQMVLEEDPIKYLEKFI